MAKRKRSCACFNLNALIKVCETDLTEIIIRELTEIAKQIKLNKTLVKARLQNRIYSLDVIEKMNMDLDTVEKDIADCQRKEMLYFEDRTTGKISEESYQKLIKSLQEKQAPIGKKAKKLREEKETIEKKFANIDKWVKQAEKYIKLKTIDRTFLEEVIDHIIVGETQEIDGVMTQDIRISYKLVGELSH